MTDPAQPQTLPPLSLTSVRVGSHQPAVLAAFYTRLFGRPADMHNGPFHMWFGACSFLVADHSDLHGPSQEPARILLNFETPAVPAEFERLKALGATVIKEPYLMDAGLTMATLADPDGNLIQFTSPMNMPSAPQ